MNGNVVCRNCGNTGKGIMGEPCRCGLKHVTHQQPSAKPTVVCLCGSTRFFDTFQRANLEETLDGKIVLSIGCDMKADDELFKDKSIHELTRIKEALDQLHLRKIDLADEVLILNVGGYIGDSTRRELEYAITNGKKIRYWEAANL